MALDQIHSMEGVQSHTEVIFSQYVCVFVCMWIIHTMNHPGKIIIQAINSDHILLNKWMYVHTAANRSHCGTRKHTKYSVLYAYIYISVDNNWWWIFASMTFMQHSSCCEWNCSFQLSFMRKCEMTLVKPAQKKDEWTSWRSWLKLGKWLFLADRNTLPRTDLFFETQSTHIHTHWHNLPSL